MEGITKEIANKEQQPQNSENLKYDPLENSGNILFGNSSDPDLHFDNTNIQNLNTPYTLPEELQKFLGDDKDENVPVLHLNIRSIKKNFENFKMFLSDQNFSFSIICFSEKWLNNSNVDNSNYELPNCVSVHQIRNHYKRGGVSVCIHKNLKFKIRNDLSINSKDFESIGVELLYEKGETLYLLLFIDHPTAK